MFLMIKLDNDDSDGEEIRNLKMTYMSALACCSSSILLSVFCIHSAYFSPKLIFI